MSDTYTVTGKVKLGRGVQEFSRDVEAESENHARELVLSRLTSEHGTSRANVTIEGVN
jgi:ribosomal protein L20A (L18A)